MGNTQTEQLLNRMMDRMDQADTLMSIETILRSIHAMAKNSSPSATGTMMWRLTWQSEPLQILNSLIAMPDPTPTTYATAVAD